MDSKKLRKALLFQHQDIIGKTSAFDGAILFMTKKLPQNPTTLKSLTKRNEEVVMKITLRKEIPPNHPTALQLMNLIQRKILSAMNMKEVGRHFYQPNDPIMVNQHKMELWPGYITSIMPYEKDVLLCAEVSHKMMRIDTVLDILYDLYEKNQKNFYDVAAREIIGQIVLTRYNNKTYRIDDIEWKENPSHTFDCRGKKISFKEYFQTQYNLEITDMKQPLLVSNPKRKDIRRGLTEPIRLLPELCTLTGLSDQMRTDFRVMKDLAIHTRQSPDQRVDKLRNLIKKIHTTPSVQDELKSWNLNIEKDLIKLTGRELLSEKIKVNVQQEFSVNPRTADWARDMQDKKIMQPVQIKDWLLICVARDTNHARSYVEKLKHVAKQIGMNFGAPTVVQLTNDSTATYMEHLRQHVTNSTQLVNVIATNSRKERYDSIKKFCYLEAGIPSQVVMTKTISKPDKLMSVATKIAIQINCKLGGSVWSCDIPVRNMMVVGIDSYHDSSKKGRSIGAFVASYDKLFTKYFSKVLFQSNHQELLSGITQCFVSALRHYSRVPRDPKDLNLPDRIMIYRDGVGDGQLKTVFEQEVPQLLEAAKRIDENYVPKITYIVVKKRINARFFLDAGTMRNPAPGTVIDQTVTKQEWYDFFVVSQSVNQGTVTPTHYNVIYDTSLLKPDHIHRLTYKLCHLYYNWQGTIRVPAPVQYAHRLAYLVGQSMHAEPSSNLADKLYYL